MAPLRRKSLRFKKRVQLGLVGSLILFSTVEAHHATVSRISSIASLYCFQSGKIERMTGKKKSTLSPKMLRAWRLGNLEFTYSQNCGLAQLNPMSISNPLFQKETLQRQMLQKMREFRETASAKESSQSVLSMESQAAPYFALLAKRLNYATRCEKKFVSTHGFGPLGQHVKETLRANAAKDIINYDTSFSGGCPGYREMSREQRQNLWVFLMMSMAHYESSCREGIHNRGPHGRAKGLLQLHDSKEDRYAQWDPDLNCSKGSAGNAKQSLRCGLTMLGNRLYRGASFFDESSHWQVLRNVQKPGSQAFQIRYALSQIPECKASPFYIDVDFKVRKESHLYAQNHKMHRATPSIELGILR